MIGLDSARDGERVWLSYYYDERRVTVGGSVSIDTSAFGFHYASDAFAPHVPIEGTAYFDPKEEVAKMWTGGKWVTLRTRVMKGEHGITAIVSHPGPDGETVVTRPSVEYGRSSEEVVPSDD